MDERPGNLHRAQSMPLGLSKLSADYNSLTRPEISPDQPSFQSTFEPSLYDRRRNRHSPSPPWLSPRTLSSPSTPRPWIQRTGSFPSTRRPSPLACSVPSPPRLSPRPNWLPIVAEDEEALESPQIDHHRRYTVVDCAVQTTEESPQILDQRRSAVVDCAIQTALASPQINDHRRSTVVDCAIQTSDESPQIDNQRRSTAVDCAIQTAVDSDSSSTRSDEFDLLQAENVRLKAEVERETDEVESLKQWNQSLTADVSATETELDKSKQELQRKTKKKKQVLHHIGQLEDSLNEDGHAISQLENAAREHRIELNKAKSQVFRDRRKEVEQKELIEKLQEENGRLLRERVTLNTKIRALEKDAKLAVEWRAKGTARIADIVKANKNLQDRVNDRNTDNIALCKRVEEFATSYAKIDDTLDDLNVMLKESEGIDVTWHTRFDKLVAEHRGLGQALNISPPNSIKSMSTDRSLQDTASTGTDESLKDIASNSRHMRRSYSVPASTSTAFIRSAAKPRRLLEERPIRPARSEYPWFSPSRAGIARLSRHALDRELSDILALSLDSPQIPILRHGEDAKIEEDEERYTAPVQSLEKSLSKELEEIGEGLDEPLGSDYTEAEPQDRGESDASDHQQRPPAAVEQAEDSADERQSTSTDDPDFNLVSEQLIKLQGRMDRCLNHMDELPGQDLSVKRNLAQWEGWDDFNEQLRALALVVQAVASTPQRRAISNNELHRVSTKTAKVTGGSYSDRTEIPTTIPSAVMSISIQPQPPAVSGRSLLANEGATDQLPPLSKTIAITMPPSPVPTASQIDHPVSGQSPFADVSATDLRLPLSETTITPLLPGPVLATAPTHQPVLDERPLQGSDRQTPRCDRPLSLNLEVTECGPVLNPKSSAERMFFKYTRGSNIKVFCADVPRTPTMSPTKSAARDEDRRPVSLSDKNDLRAHQESPSESGSLGDTGRSLGDQMSSSDFDHGSSSSQKSSQIIKFDWYSHIPDDGSSIYECRLSKMSDQAKERMGVSNQDKRQFTAGYIRKLAQRLADLEARNIALAEMLFGDPFAAHETSDGETTLSLSEDEICTRVPLVQQPSICIKMPPLQVSLKAMQTDQPSEVANAHRVLPVPTGDHNNIEDASNSDSDLPMVAHNFREQTQRHSPESPVHPFNVTATNSRPESEAEDEPYEDDLLHIADLLDMELDEKSTLTVLIVLEALEQNPDDTWVARLQATSITLESGPERKEAMRKMFEEAIIQLMELDGELPEMETMHIPEAVEAGWDSQARQSPNSPVPGPERREAIKKLFEDAASNINAMKLDESPFSPATTSSSYSDFEDGEPVLYSRTAPDENDSESALELRPVRHVLGPSHLAGALRYHVKKFVASSDPRRWEMTFHPGSLALTSASSHVNLERYPVHDGHIIDRIEEVQEEDSALETADSTHSEGEPTAMRDASEERSMSVPMNVQAESLSGPIFAGDRVQYRTPRAEPQQAGTQAPTLLEMSWHFALMQLVLFLRRIMSIPIGILKWLYELAHDHQAQTLGWLMMFMAWMIVCDRAQMWFDANNGEYRHDQVRMHYQETWGHPGLEKLTFRVVQWLDLTHEIYGHSLYRP